MTDKQEIFFEIKNSGNFVRLEPISVDIHESSPNWASYWIKTQVFLKGGQFSGQFTGGFMAVDFERFKRELSNLYDHLDWTANFDDLEGYLTIKIQGDGLGHFTVNIFACDQPDQYGSKLNFDVFIDQTEINELVNQLDRIINEFKIPGSIKNKNK